MVLIIHSLILHPLQFHPLTFHTLIFHPLPCHFILRHFNLQHFILGYSENGYHSDDCYTMDLATGEFSKYADLYQPRIYSGPYGAFTGLILFSGGYPLGSNESKSSEVFLDAAADSGPFHFHTADLPTPRKQHCSVFDNTVNQDGNWPGWWITGGRIGELENKTYSGDVTSSM